jgi:subtilisin family serine protease
VIPYGIKLTQSDLLSDANAGNRKVCIIDSGYDRNHEDLNGNPVTGEYDSGTGWWYTDENHHGTHVAGTIAGINNGTGVVGVNPNKKLKLHIVKVFSADGWAYSSSLVTAANKCKAAGANVISMSLGGGAKSKTEERAFNNLYSGGILSIAAAGNDGNTVMSYPASYTSVMSVGALDENKQWASFSQYNSQVEISAPGVSVLSTVTMGVGREGTLSVGGTAYTAAPFDGSAASSVSAALVDCGIGSTTCSGATGKVCLIQRGTVDFVTKVNSCKNGGGVGAIIYNVSDVDGAALKTRVGSTAAMAVNATNYAFYDGTSMATPHVSAIAALVWSYFPTCTAANIRKALTATAEDLGTVGRDTKYGFGMVRANNARQYLATYGCAGA